MKSIAIFGGTFDPIHSGHLNVSIQIQNSFHFDKFYYLPCNIPLLKAKASASNPQRIQMIQLAIQHIKDFSLDCREINSLAPSYMVNTLKSIHKDYPKASITLIMGYDAFVSLPKWHQWEQIIHLAHLLVINRLPFSNVPIPESIQDLLNKHQTQNKTDLFKHPAGFIFLFDAGFYDVSSTEIRQMVKEGHVLENKLPKEVYDYIVAEKIY